MKVRGQEAAFAKFSPATRAQLELSRDVAEMLHGEPLETLADAWINA